MKALLLLVLVGCSSTDVMESRETRKRIMEVEAAECWRKYHAPYDMQSGVCRWWDVWE